MEENKKRPFNLLDDKFVKEFAFKYPEIIKIFLLKLLNIVIKDAKIEYLNTVLPITKTKEYLKTVDFNILINDNIIIDLEINNSPFSLVKERNYVYFSRIINSVLNEGDKPNRLKYYEVYQINLNGNVRDNKHGIRVVMNYYRDNKKKYLNNVKIYEINLVYYKNLLYTEGVNKKLSKRDILLGSLKSNNIEEFDNYLKRCVSSELRNKIIKEVKQSMEKVFMAFTEKESQGLTNMVEEEFKDFIEEEREDAKKEGVNQSKLEIAKNLLLQKIPIDVIKKATGLSLKTIKNIVL